MAGTCSNHKRYSTRRQNCQPFLWDLESVLMPDISRSRQLRQGARCWLDVAKSQEIHGLLRDALGGGNARVDGIVSVAASLFQSLKSRRVPGSFQVASGRRAHGAVRTASIESARKAAKCNAANQAPGLQTKASKLTIFRLWQNRQDREARSDVPAEPAPVSSGFCAQYRDSQRGATRHPTIC